MPERKPSALIGDMLKCILLIGEAVSKLPEEVKNNEPQIPWASIKGMRNRLIHDYIGTDFPLVWNVIKMDLPAFEKDLERIYNSLIEEQ